MTLLIVLFWFCLKSYDYFIPRTAVLDGGEAVEGDVELGDDVYTKGVKKEKPKKKILVIF